jgi:hypothetical protein
VLHAIRVQDWRGMQPPIKYGNRKALDDLLTHRGGWALMSGPYDVSGAIAEIENDIVIIEAGITNLNSSAWRPRGVDRLAVP